ncbi:MAG: hypothetical protein Q9196_007119, partial [Gyalolechia fulgens]
MYPELARLVKEVLDKKRHSDVSALEQEQFVTTHEAYQDLNEDTLLNELMPFLIKHTRTVSKSVSNSLESEADIRDDEEQVVVAFCDDGFMRISN